MGFNFQQYAATQQDAEDRTTLIMRDLNEMSDLDFLSPKSAETTVNGRKTTELSSSRPPSPPDSGTTTPRLTIKPCPERLTPYYPPPNYGTVENHKIYRSSFPQDRHISFVGGLGIKSVLTLVETEPGLGFQYWLESDGISWAKLHIGTNKDKSGRIDTKLDSICAALLFIMDSSNYPVYVHCNQGKHRTGCVIACLRRVQGWSVDEAIKEYNVYAGEKSRPGDRALIETFDPNAVFEYAKTNGVLDGLSNSIGGRQNIFRRQDSMITDIHGLRAALDTGLVGEMELDSTDSSDISSGSLSPPLTAPTPTVRLLNPNGGVQTESVGTKTTEYMEDIRFSSREVQIGEDGSMNGNVEGEQHGVPLERP